MTIKYQYRTLKNHHYKILLPKNIVTIKKYILYTIKYHRILSKILQP